MNEEESTGSIFDAIDAAQSNSDEELSQLSRQNPDFSTAAEIEIDDTSEKEGNLVFSNSMDLPDLPEAEKKQPFTTENTDADEIKPFNAEKISANDAMDRNGQRKPPVLNKQFILRCITGVFSILIIFSLLIYPELMKKREKNTVNKPIPRENTSFNYSTLIEKENLESDSKSDDKKTYDKKTEAKTDDENIENLPPVTMTNEKYTYKEPSQQNTSYSSSSRSTYEIPDTRTDALQSMSINGIKGISSTQKNYLTPDFNNTTSAKATDTKSALSSSSSSSNPYAKFGMPDQASYTNQLINQYASSNNSYAQQNDQSGKNTFYNQNRGNVSGQWLPLNSLWQGTIFDAALTSDISTDLPGECTAVVTKNIYSSQDGRYLLIPQNSKLYGSYNSSISYSQKRVQVGWHTLIRPDGYMVNLGNFNTTDAKGASGLKGAINDHPFAYLKAIALMSAVNIVNSELQATMATNQNQYVQNVMANSQQVATTLGEKLIDRAMNVQPTITIKAGAIINIVANTTLELPVLEPWEVVEPYKKNKK